jgi:hypothetical protein
MERKLKLLGILLAATFGLVACGPAFEQAPYLVDGNSYNGIGNGGAGSSNGGGQVSLPGGEDTGNPAPPPNMYSLAQSIANANPGMINDCAGHPYANNFLITVVNALRKQDRRWGFFKKPDGRVPRDILAYDWRGEGEGTANTFVIDFVTSGCNNTQPSDSHFADPAGSAGVGWDVTNPEGYAGNGVWTANP